jgi:hypothetical protein
MVDIILSMIPWCFFMVRTRPKGYLIIFGNTKHITICIPRKNLVWMRFFCDMNMMLFNGELMRAMQAVLAGT